MVEAFECQTKKILSNKLIHYRETQTIYNDPKI